MFRNPSPRLSVLVAAFILSLAAVGCVPARLGTSWASLSTVGEKQNILIVYDKFLAMVDAETGKEVQLVGLDGEIRRDDDGNILTWDVTGLPSDAQYFSSPVLQDEETLLLADFAKERFFQVDFETARPNPAVIQSEGKVVADAVSDGSSLYMPLFEGDLVAHDLANPQQIEWSYNAVNTAEDDQIKNGVWAEPLIDGDTIYFGSMDHYLYAADLATGEMQWKTNLEGALAASPVLYNNHLYIGSFSRKLYEVSPSTGDITNSFETADWLWGSPVIVDGTLYTADLAGNVYALNLDGGFQTIWSGKKTRMGIRPAPVVTEQYVIVVSRDGQMVWLDRATGDVMYEHEIGAEVLSDILLIEPSETLDIPDSLVVVSSIDHTKTLVAFSLDNAAPQWTYGR